MNPSKMEHDSSVATVPAQPFLYERQPVRLTTQLYSLDYNMNHKHRGYCIIFNNETFSKQSRLPPRHGSKVDLSGLINLFRAMSFDVKVCENQTAKQMRYQLEYYARQDHRDNDCFVCFVLSHGEHGQIWGTDTKFAINYLFDEFLGDKCPSLIGKPKLFFIQACQGDKLDHGVNVVAESLDGTAYFKLPSHADFLVAYSTLPGFYSWRNTQDGSWFMQALIRVLSDHHHELDLLTMLTIVNYRVAYFKSSNASSLEFNNKKQVPCITSMLTRRVFLQPKKLLG